MRALGKIDLLEPGTNLRAWLFTILHHQHIGLTRRNTRQRASIELRECNSGLTQPADQTGRLELRDLARRWPNCPRSNAR
jgi:RNA polymerase sigma-70 factor (ECF subfamily)